ncbi:hypothetical protein QTP88_013573 [Uroleucon formosanum]
MIFKKRSSATGISSTIGRGAHNLIILTEIRTRMLNHIKSFPLQESHYARKRISRLYLSSSLNINKIYDLYKDHYCQNGIIDESYWLYRTVFSETDLKSKIPYVDTCKTVDENVRGKIPLKVTEMEQIDFKSFSSFLSGPLVKRTLDADKEKVNWLKMTWIRYNKTFGIIQFMYTLNKEALFRVLDLRKRAIKTRYRAELTSGVSNIRLP